MFAGLLALECSGLGAAAVAASWTMAIVPAPGLARLQSFGVSSWNRLKSGSLVVFA